MIGHFRIIPMKKLLCLLLAVLLLLSTVACSSPSYSREEILVELEALLDETHILNDIYFGEGIPVKENGYKVSVYQEADMSSLQEYGMTDIESIRAKTAEVFSISMCAWLDEIAFNSFSSGITVEGARYYKDSENRIMVRTTSEVYVDGTVEYDLSSMKILSQRKDIVYTELRASVTTPEGNTRSDTIKVDLIKEQDGWRLHSPTYFVYD